MQLIYWTKPKMIVSSEGKWIRDVNDVYVAEHTDEQTGEKKKKKTPHYTTTIFVPDNFTEEQMNELYVEEEIKESEV